MVKKSISVPELQRILGVNKGVAYYLVRQGYFETIIVGTRMRVMVDSFEKWYANQFHYKKVNGPAPGQSFSNTLSAGEIAAMLGLRGSTVYELLKQPDLKVVWVNGHPRINREVFEDWYATQFHYKKVDGTAPGQKFPDTLSATEIARMLGVHRNTVYVLLDKGLFKVDRAGKHPRIDRASFETWLQSQTHYKKKSA